MTAAELVVAVNAWVWQQAHVHGRRLGLDPEDLAQETFLRIIRYAHTYDPAKGTPTTWAAVICARVAGETAKGNPPTLSLDYENAFDMTLLDRIAGDTEREGGLDTVEMTAVRNAVARLPPHLGDVVTSYYGLDGRPALTQEQIATASQCTRAWIAMQLNQARALLAADLGA